jgi:phosphoribosyl 1,2-cyclic phosphodiesterase
LFVFRALASGSSGNSYLLRTPGATLLFDAGLRLNALRTHLAAEGIDPSAITALLISHEHRDHCAGAQDLATKYRIPVCANSEVLQAAGLSGLPSAEVMDVGKPMKFGDVEVTSFPVPHDAVRPVGFVARVQERTITIATDLGSVTDEVIEAVEQADLLVLEANHDTEMLQRGRYPYHLRRRVAGPSGHLSNTQTANALVRHLSRHDVDVWLAHLSKENNTPALALRTVQRALKARGWDSVTVGVAQRDRPSLRWDGIGRPRQLSLFAEGA